MARSPSQHGGFVKLVEDRSEEAQIRSKAASPSPGSQASIDISPTTARPSVLSEVDRLFAEDPATAARVERLTLTDSERDVLSLSVRKMNNLGTWAETYANRTSQLFATQVLCAAAVPVLIGLLGSFSEFVPNLTVRIVAIALSIIGTVCRALEDAYDWKAQAAIRRRCLTRMRLLFDWSSVADQREGEKKCVGGVFGTALQ